jgi:hypothetical protein
VVRGGNFNLFNALPILMNSLTAPPSDISLGRRLFNE